MEVVDQRSIVNSLAKGLRVLEAFGAEVPEMTLSEVADAADLDPGTAHRMLKTLQLLGYVHRDPVTKRFKLTLKVADLGFNAIGRTDFRDLARPILRALVGELTEAASLGVLDGADILYLERVRAGMTRLGVDIRTGTTIPAYCSAIGHSILAFSPDETIERVMSTAPRSDHVPIEPFDEKALNEALSVIRERSYALTSSLVSGGLIILAAPVLDRDGYAMAAVSLVAPTFRTSPEAFEENAAGPVRQAAGEIAKAMQVSGTTLAVA